MKTSRGYLRLSNNFFPKYIEHRYLLDKTNDDLYELSRDAFDLILRCNGTCRLEDMNIDGKFVARLLKQDILQLSSRPSPRRFIVQRPPLPSLRYLEIQLTGRCNLACRHCYQGAKKDRDLPLKPLLKTLDEFVRLQGLRILLSGGEPLLYKYFRELNGYLKDYPARVVLLTNGTLITNDILRTLNVDEIQFSLDGMNESHEHIRGKGTFRKLIAALDASRDRPDIAVSFATMAHAGSIRDLPAMKKFVASWDAKEWGIDYPVMAGNLINNSELYPPLKDVKEALSYRFGASSHATGDDGRYACGAHLMTLTPDCRFMPCGFFPERSSGTIRDGLAYAVKNRGFFSLRQIRECSCCKYLRDCRGGCRYRAGALSKKDPVMCKIYGCA